MIKQEELSPEQYIAIKEFANGLKQCFEAKKKSKEIPSINMDYVIGVINLHVGLKAVDMEYTLAEMEKAQKKVVDKS
jgi:hypothetical protein